MLHYKAVITALAALLLGACNNAEQAKPEEDTSVKIDFVEYEKNSEPYPTRLIVTNKFMRFDDGEDSTSFLLFDRDGNTIYSVNDDDRTVMSVESQDIDLEPPMELNLEEHNLGTLEDAPAIEGKEPQHYEFSANGDICYNVVAVEDLMPDVVEAMKAFTTILADDSKVTFNNMPADLHDACDMSMSTFAAGRHLKHGFPIQEWSVDGAGRTLVDYDKDYEPDPALFEVPGEDYQHFSVQEMREGKVTGGGH
ncbi:hypothetical protein [Thiohalophilus thiocyanatoxydans]|uniref:DUF4412 domain-containing protein n=1 Tax=Thiohalophilus thiocyanatoxydans TaxID=381308 RepID=A0A4R8IRC6_9GAMM|nr:hypothetical protein [Thiohalophilus thiocyanatoxydans]TDY00049.1 hypothetical protein EDC23_2210 [Thiohalophilus thiocyanatoxydans]